MASFLKSAKPNCPRVHRPRHLGQCPPIQHTSVNIQSPKPQIPHLCHQLKVLARLPQALIMPSHHICHSSTTSSTNHTTDKHQKPGVNGPWSRLRTNSVAFFSPAVVVASLNSRSSDAAYNVTLHPSRAVSRRQDAGTRDGDWEGCGVQAVPTYSFSLCDSRCCLRTN